MTPNTDTTKDTKTEVAVRVTSPYQENSANPMTKDKSETTHFRDTLKKCIEQEFANLGDVEIVEDDIQNRWDYFIFIVFDTWYQQKQTKPVVNIPFVKISVSIYDAHQLVNFYTPETEPTLDQLDTICKNITIDFERQFLDPKRKIKRH